MSKKWWSRSNDLEFDELNKLINLSNNMIKAMGSTEKTSRSKNTKRFLQKNLYQKGNKKGSEIKGNMIRTVVSKNPNGVDPEQYYSIINRTVKENIPKDEIITYDHLVK